MRVLGTLLLFVGSVFMMYAVLAVASPDRQVRGAVTALTGTGVAPPLVIGTVLILAGAMVRWRRHRRSTAETSGTQSVGRTPDEKL